MKTSVLRVVLPLTWMLTVAVTVTTMGCGGSIRVQTDYDPSADFASYSSFTVLEEAGDDTAPGFLDARIKAAIARTPRGPGSRPGRRAAGPRRCQG